MPVRHFHPDKQTPSALHIPSHILDTKSFEIFLSEVVPILEHERQPLQDPWPASSWGHAVGDDAPYFTQATWKEIRDHYQAMILRYEGMGPDYMLGVVGAKPLPRHRVEGTHSSRKITYGRRSRSTDVLTSRAPLLLVFWQFRMRP